MPEVTINGIPGVPNVKGFALSSEESAAVVKQVLDSVYNSFLTGNGFAITDNTPTNLSFYEGNSNITVVLDTGTAPLSISDNSSNPVTVISGSGGLTYISNNTFEKASANVFLESGGGVSNIALGYGTGTVVADGTSTIGAVMGGDMVYATSGGQAMIYAGHGATVHAAGNDTIAYYGIDAQVFADNGSNLQFIGSNANDINPSTPINQTDSGAVTISAIAGSYIDFTGYGGMITIDESAGGKNVLGSFGKIGVDAEASNVLVLPGAGAVTLFGSGEAGALASNRGSDTVIGGNGYFHGGEGNNILETSSITGGATLVGGSKTGFDHLYSQGAYDVLIGDVNTTIIDASGQSNPDFGYSFQNVPINAGGDLLNAGWAKQVSIYGAAGGANTVVSGIGSATVIGNHGNGSGNVYIDGKNGNGNSDNSILIQDFVVGLDKFLLQGATIVNSTNINNGSVTTLSDGTRIVLNGVAFDKNIFS